MGTSLSTQNSHRHLLYLGTVCMYVHSGLTVDFLSNALH